MLIGLIVGISQLPGRRPAKTAAPVAPDSVPANA
jgi:hypothetical protein